MTPHTDAGDYDPVREANEDAAQDQDTCPKCYGMTYIEDGDDWVECLACKQEVTP